MFRDETNIMNHRKLFGALQDYLLLEHTRGGHLSTGR